MCQKPNTTGHLFSIVATAFCARVLAAETIHVDAANTASGYGEGSATNPYKFLATALAAAEQDDLILVAKGEYRPDQTALNPSGADVASATFLLKSAVLMRGGYPGDGE